MKRKTLSTILASALACGSLTAQTVNYAIENADGTGQVNALTITELDNSTEATIQLWVKAYSWYATLIAQDNFSLSLTGTRRLTFAVGQDSVSITATGLTLRNWTHLGVTYKDGDVTFYVNGRALSSDGSVEAAIPATARLAEERGCTIGAGLTGQLDEIRVWGTALDADSLYYRNTVNLSHPDYASLVAYWKCDQEQCPYLYDYTGGHHGELDGVTRVESDNDDLKYRVVTGYTDLMRFIDRGYINRNMFLMTNDVIILSAKLWDDGSIFIQYPDNSMTGTNTAHLDEWEGRTGIIDFGGEGAVMTAADPRSFNDPRGTQGYQASSNITFEGWFYIDTWNEGAQLVSQYLDDGNCFVASLGSADEQELTVNVCGTTATLKGQLATGRWQYLAVYLTPAAGQAGDAGWAPVRIAVGQDDGSGFTSQLFTTTSDTPVEMGGEAMTITSFPALLGSTLTLGNGFDGKMDEVMVWASDRSGSITTDATEPYQWNVGSWNNVFLASYWKGDDPDNPGKDYQSYTHMMDIIRGYYDGYRGNKLRLGLVDGSDDGWLTVLADEGKVDNFIASCKQLITQCDGFDVDFEWMYNSSQWSIYNNVVRRLANEVMADQPDKVFSCSLHYVSYNGFPSDLMSDVDYFTMQIYGPQTATYTWDYYEQAYNAFTSYGFPKDKLLLSYGILITAGAGTVEGYKDLFDSYGFGEAYDPDLNTWDCNGTTKYFNGVNQTIRKQEYILDNDVRGTMYFDMGNDLRVTDPRSLIRAQNSVIAANVDTLVTTVEMPPVPDAIDHATTAGGDKLNEGNGQWYDLSGRPVAQPGRGIYIRNGQKRANP